MEGFPGVQQRLEDMIRIELCHSVQSATER